MHEYTVFFNPLVLCTRTCHDSDHGSEQTVGSNATVYVHSVIELRLAALKIP